MFRQSHYGQFTAAQCGRGIEDISAVACSSGDELVYAGTSGGWSHAILPEHGSRYSSVHAHQSAIRCLLPHREGYLSLSSTRLTLHSPGGLLLASLPSKDHEFVACTQASAGPMLYAAWGNGTIVSVALPATTQLQAAQVSTQPSAICSTGLHGQLAVGLCTGQVALVDADGGGKVTQTVMAHSQGLAALAAAGSLFATSGWGSRAGQPVPDPFIKVYDLRQAARVLHSIPFQAGPAQLSWHPLSSSTLLAAGPTGAFILADAQAGLVQESGQVATGGSTLTCCSMSPSSQVLAFGCQGGSVLLHGLGPTPHVSMSGAALQRPVQQPSAVQLQELQPFGLAATYPCKGPRLSHFEGWHAACGAARRLPPRVLDPQLAQTMQRVDFVGHVANPFYRRGLPPGQAGCAIAPMRDLRASPQPHKSLDKTSPQKSPSKRARSSLSLPANLQRQPASTRFQEDSSTNLTRFLGLQGHLANSYANAVLQVLHFVPAMRRALLQHKPSPEADHSLADEAALLERMLSGGAGSSVAATNVLRALRQSHQAAALGLLEGQAQASLGTQDIQVEANKDQCLPRRAQSLHRFLLEHLSRQLGSEAAQLQEQQAEGQRMDSKGTAAADVRGAFEMQVQHRTQSLSGDGEPSTRTTSTFQVQLQYPSSSKRPGIPKAGAAGHQLPPWPHGAERPSFAQLLAGSLHLRTEARIWVEAANRYQWTQQTRSPLTLPQVLSVGCGMADRGDLLWWQPEQPSESADAAAQAAGSWLPGAICVSVSSASGDAQVLQGSDPADFPADMPDGEGSVRAVYELSAVVWHIQDADEDEEGSAQQEGHLVAHIKVPVSYMSSQYGCLPSPTVAESPGQSPLVWLGGPRAPARAPFAAARPLPKADSGLDTEASTTLQDDGELALLGDDSSPGVQRAPSLPAAVKGLRVSAGEQKASEPMPDRVQETRRQGPVAAQVQQWLLFNDDRVEPARLEDVVQLYGWQKAPCIVCYTQVEAATGEPAAYAPAPVLTAEQFTQLCKPAQAPRHPQPSPDTLTPSFVPLAPDEPPGPGMLLGLDAEFVAVSLPDVPVHGQGSMDGAARPARLAVARVSLVRGEGPQAGLPVMDDYLRMTEHVADYLTQWSGLQAGDLDTPHPSRHLTTHKKAYLKLRYLVDAGCTFVGHGLKQDFHMINITVPPAQVVDTVELFHFKRQRKLSLRFLSAYLLRSRIQQGTHDSVEDARAALALFQKYQELQKAGTFGQVLLDMYRAGKQYGWDGAQLGDKADQPSAV